MRTSSRNFAVLLFDEVELWDVASVMQVAAMAGRHWNWRPFRLLPTARRAGLVATRSQLRVEAATALSDCPAPEIVLVPGGYGARRAAEDAEVTGWCKRAAESSALLLAIGSGVLVLGAAGLLDGADVAAARESEEWLSQALPQARFQSGRGLVVSQQGQLVTAPDSSFGLDLGLFVVERCLGKRTRQNLEAQLGRSDPIARLTLDPAQLKLPPR